jgi:hypothetical protein
MIFPTHVMHSENRLFYLKRPLVDIEFDMPGLDFSIRQRQ